MSQVPDSSDPSAVQSPPPGVLATLARLFAPLSRVALKIHHAVTYVITIVLVFVAYFVAIGPLSVWLRLTSALPMDQVKPLPGTHWLNRIAPPPESLDQLRKRFQKQF